MTAARELTVHPDHHLPSGTELRPVARRIYAETAGLPIVSPHGHVDARVLADDLPFDDPATLLVSSDHYVTRLIHSHGVSLDDLGVGKATAPPREVWRIFCAHWDRMRATPSRAWLESELHDVLGVRVHPSPDTADALFDQLSERLARPDMRPRALYRSFGIEVLATTDDPCSDLVHHRALRDDPSWDGRVVPTFRPDRLLDPAHPDWAGALDELAVASGADTTEWSGLVEGVEARRGVFAEMGGRGTDHGHYDAGCDPLPAPDITSLYTRLRREAAAGGAVSEADAAAFRRHMLFEMARMASEDGMVMQLHPGVLRGYDRSARDRYGPDTGHDIPVALELTRSLRPILEAFGTNPRFRLVVHTVDETVWTRELAPLAGFYPCLYVGAPWWFLDTPSAMGRFKDAVVDTVGFGKLAGFVDDTRAYCSIPARHDLARRVDAGHLARLVGEHVLSEDEAIETARDLAYGLPRSVYRLG